MAVSGSNLINRLMGEGEWGEGKRVGRLEYGWVRWECAEGVEGGNKGCGRVG